MSYLAKAGQSLRIVTTNAEESAEVGVANLEQNRAKDRVICKVSQEYMLICFLMTSGTCQNVNASFHIELSTHPSEAEIKEDERRN